MQRGVEAERGGGSRDVVHVAVGNHDRAADPLRRRVRERPPQRGEELGALGVRFLPRGFDDAQIDVAERVETRLHLVAPLVSLPRSLADVLAGGAVDDEGDDVLQRAPVLLHEIGIAEAQDEEREGERPEPGAAHATPDENDRDGERNSRQRNDCPRREERREGDRPDAQRVSLSMMSLAWT